MSRFRDMGYRGSLSGVFAVAEDGGAEADAGGAFFDGYEEVVGHAHGQFGEGWAGGEVLVAETAKVLEEGARGGGVWVEGWDGHEPVGADRSEWREGGEQGGELGGVEAVLGVFVGELDFDEDGEGFVEGPGGGVEARGGFEGVDGVDGLKELGGGAGLVVLERADEMDGEVGERGEKRLFGGELLDSVFAEEALAGGVGFEDNVGWVGLADGHEGDGGGVAVGAGAGVGDLIAEAFEVSGDAGRGHGLDQCTGTCTAIFVRRRLGLHPVWRFPRPKG
jgi:hypothetical protein